MEVVQPPSAAGMPAEPSCTYTISNDSVQYCPNGAMPHEMQGLVTAVESRMTDSFHWTELYLGALLALLAMLGAALLFWEWREHRRKRDAFRTAENLRFNVDANYLKRLIGQDDAPSWLKNPDYERLGFVNDIIVHLWPHIAASASVMVRDLAEPILHQSKPKWMSDISLHTFTLGDIPPRVHCIKVFRQESLVEELLIEMDLTWTGNQKFQLQINPLPNLPVPLGIGALMARWLGFRVGVGDIAIRGRVRLALKPLLNKVPVVGGVKVSLLEQPSLSYALIVQGGDISFLPGLEVFINNVLREQVLRPYILPDGYTLPLVPGGGREMPAGILYLHLIEARNLPNMDWISKTDAYALVYVRGRRKRRTHVVYNSLCPKFEEYFELLVHDPEHQSATMVLCNKSNLGADEEIGRIVLPIKDLPPGQIQDLWLDLGPPERHNAAKNPVGAGIRGVRKVGRAVEDTVFLKWLRRRKEAPKVLVQAAFYKVGAEAVKAAHSGASSEEVGQAAGAGAGTEASGEARGETAMAAEARSRVANMLRGGILYVKIRKGGDDVLAVNDDDGVPRRATQVVVRVADDEKRTSEAEGKDNPDWEETLEFAVGGDFVDREGELIEVEVWDYHWVNAPSALTWVNSPASLPWAQNLLLQGRLPTEGWVDIPLKEVVERRSMHDTWSLNDIPEGRIEMELQWLPVLEEAA